MNCKEAEKRIYLETELNEKEKAELANHLGSCNACHSLHASVVNMRHGITSLANEEISPLDSSRLTDKVMSGIFTEKKQSAPSFGIWFRLGLSAISLMLVLTFYMEFSHSPDVNQGRTMASATVSHTGGTKILRQRDERQVSLMALAEVRKEIYLSNNNTNETH